MPTTITPRQVLLAAGAGAALAAVPRLLTGLALLRAMIAPSRQALKTTPAARDLPYEPASFTSTDGVSLHGWFLPGAGPSKQPVPAVVIVHGWPWNRLGNAADHPIAPGVPNRPVDLLAPAAALQRAGIHVLMFDLRNHGISGASRPVTFGLREARDLAAAVRWLRQRADVAGQRLGLLGFSMGANTAILGIPAMQPIAAAALIQPVQPSTFAANLARSFFGPLAPLMVAQTEFFYGLAGGPRLAEIDVIGAAANLGPTAALYVQGTGDPWGTIADVQRMAKQTPGPTEVVLPETNDRFGGYRWTADHAGELVEFFQRRL